MATTLLAHALERLRAGDQTAAAALLEHSLGRLHQMARRQFRRQPDLRRLAETDDVLQQALVRLTRTLAAVPPADPRHYFALAAGQIRWTLLDLAERAAATPTAVPTHEVDLPSASPGPADLAGWADFHRSIDRLPPDHREVFDLLLYQGLSQPEAAEVAGLSLRTLKRRWAAARVALADALRGEWPDLP